MKRLILAALLIMSLAGPAMADDCTDMIDRIDLALQTAVLDDVTKAQVMGYYDQGKMEHDAGNHVAAEAQLTQALNLLGV